MPVTHGILVRNRAILFLVVTICVLTIATFQINPLVPVGKIGSITDQRVEFTSLQAAGVYSNHYVPVPLTTAEISDINTLFVNPQNDSSPYLLTSLLPSPYAPQYKLGPDTAVYYTNGPIIIVGK